MFDYIFKLGRYFTIFLNIVVISFLVFLFSFKIFTFFLVEKVEVRSRVTPLILSFKRLQLSKNEENAFLKANPLGFILRSHNMKDPEQTKSLIEDLRSLFPKRRILIFIDQEGGRVDRLFYLTGTKYPEAKYYGDLAKEDLENAKKELYKDAKKMASELKYIGFDVNLAPILDIGDTENSELSNRIFSDDMMIAKELISVFIEAFSEVGVYVVLKHIPGSGRSSNDTHDSFSYIDASLAELEDKDFELFKIFSNHSKFAMVNHVVYGAIDKDLPATLSPNVIKLIKEDIGFNDLLISDAFNMKALKDYSLTETVRMSLDAGLDIVMPNQCAVNAVLEVLEVISEDDLVRFQQRLEDTGMHEIIAY